MSQGPVPLLGATCSNLPGPPTPTPTLSVCESRLLLARPLQHWSWGSGLLSGLQTPGLGHSLSCDAHASSGWLPSVHLSVCLSVCLVGSHSELSHPEEQVLRDAGTSRGEEAASSGQAESQVPPRLM